MSPAPLRQTALAATDTLRRFPASIAIGFATTVIAALAVEPHPPSWADETLRTAILGIPLIVAAELVTDRLRLGRAISFGVCLAAVGLLAGLNSVALHAPDDRNWIRFFDLALGFHLLVACVPLAGRAGPNEFWQFNRTLFQRVLVSLIYSGVLFAGLGIALVALDKLLGIPIPMRTYPRLFATIAFLFNTWFFLAGIPRDWEALARSTEYPLPLKVFAQYLLVPLVSVYLVILMLYLGRVGLTRTWPSGWIGYLVSSVALTGTLALLLVHPARERPDEKWINTYGRWFFVVMLPPLGMLFLAAGKRIGQYGVTEPRYALVALAAWFTGLALYYALTGARTIRPFPATLAAVCLATTVGPWSIFAVSRRSQTARYTQLSRDAAANGPEMVRVLGYLKDRHGMAAVAAAIGVPADSASAWARTATLDDATRRAGISEARDEARSTEFDAASGNDRTGMEVAPGLWLFPSRNFLWPSTIHLGADTLELRPFADEGRLEIRHRDSVLVRFDLAAGVAPFLGPPGAARHPGRGPIVIEQAAGSTSFRLVIDHVSWYALPRDSLSRMVTGTILVRRP